MHEILEDITHGRGTMEQLDLLEELACVVQDTAMCGLGQTAANPVLSALRYFREEFVQHIEEHRCPAGVCRELISYSIGEACTGCGACVRVCHAGAIYGAKGEQHSIDQDKCIKCGACREACNSEAVMVA